MKDGDLIGVVGLTGLVSVSRLGMEADWGEQAEKGCPLVVMAQERLALVVEEQKRPTRWL